MDLQNLAYALTQVAHNFGAAMVVGGAAFARWPAPQPPGLQRRLAWLVLLGWTVQGATGAGFGLISQAYYGQFPELHDIAAAALLLKVTSVALGLVVTAAFLRYADGWPEAHHRLAWSGLIVLAATALTAAAFLRWFS